jgi:octaprenyl-diphosphate synthase
MGALKTGVLARMAAELGVYAAGNRVDLDPAREESTAATLGMAAEKLGVAFQILDDVKNLSTGNPGKKRGDDIVEGKKSLPVLLFLHSRNDRVEFVKRCFSAARASGTGAKEVEELIGELDASGSIEQARQRGLQLIAEAKQSMETQAFRFLDTDSAAKELLLNLVSELV